MVLIQQSLVENDKTYFMRLCDCFVARIRMDRLGNIVFPWNELGRFSVIDFLLDLNASSVACVNEGDMGGETQKLFVSGICR